MECLEGPRSFFPCDEHSPRQEMEIPCVVWSSEMWVEPGEPWADLEWAGWSLLTQKPLQQTVWRDGVITSLHALKPNSRTLKDVEFVVP